MATKTSKTAKKAQGKSVKKSTNKNRDIQNRSNKPNFFQRLFLSGNLPLTVQETIPYKRMYPDGICELYDGTFSKTLRFQDTNYSLAQDDEKLKIFNTYSKFLNYFDDSVPFQLTFLNRKGQEKLQGVNYKEKDDAFNDIRKERMQMIDDQLSKGNSGIIKHKYLTFGVKGKNYKQVKQRLQRIETDVMNKFKRELNTVAEPLNGKERLEVMYKIMNVDKPYNQFAFNWNNIKGGGLDTKDFIAPGSFNFEKRYFETGNAFGCTVAFNITAPELSDEVLLDFLNIKNDLVVNIHVQSIEQGKAIKEAKKKIMDLNQTKADLQMKNMQKGIFTDISSPTLNKNVEEAENQLDALQQRNERHFLTTFIITATADTKKELDDIIFSINGVMQKYNCNMRKLDYQQENAFMSSLPLCYNEVRVDRRLSTSALGILIPFSVQELYDTNGGLSYGVNAQSNNIILANRRSLTNPNGLIIGIPGSGKSVTAKLEITDVFLSTNDDIIISDPEAEYRPLVEALGGQVIEVSMSSKDYINPMDINVNYGLDQDPIAVKSDFIMGLCELILKRNNVGGLNPVQMSVLDRCVRKIYTEYFTNPTEENMPILEDLYNELLQQKDNALDAKIIADALEIYVKGSLNVFNNKTNVDLNNRIVCYDIKNIGRTQEKIGMLIIQDNVWNQVSKNRDVGRATWFYQDEFHKQLRDDQSTAYSLDFWKRFRKWGGIPTGITQNIKDLLRNFETENILDNSDFLIMMNQAAGDRNIIAKKLQVSDDQLSFVIDSPVGEGLIKYGSQIVPFRNKVPRDTKLYKLITTKPGESEI